MAVLGNVKRAIGTTLHNVGTKARLPELGLSEKFGVGKAYAAPKSVKGVNTSVPNYGFSGQNTSLNMPGFKPQPFTSPGGGGGGGGGGGQPQQQFQSAQQPDFSQYAPEQASIDYDALIAPALQALESSIAPLQQGFESYQGEQRAGGQTQIEKTRADITGQKGILETGRTRQQKIGESAIDEARRQYSEIQQGLQSRYGGSTGTGRFASELSGRESLRNIANVREGLSQAMLEIDNKLQQVQEVGRIAEQDITNQTESRIGEARRALDNQIADIRKQQGLLQAQKAQMAAESIQQYQNSVNQYKQQQQQFMQTLFMQQQNAEQQLKAAMQRGRGVAESFKLYNLSSGGQTTPVRIGNQGTVQGVGGAQAPVVGPGSTVYDISGLPKTEEEDENLF